MTIKPTRDNMLIRMIKPVLQSSGGIMLVDRYQDDRMQWVVEAVGPGCKLVQPGDRILTPLYFDHMTLDDGRKIASEKQAIMRWGRGDENE